MVNGISEPPKRRLPKFYILVTVHLGIVLINNQSHAQFLLYIFISILYMFGATLCSSSGESIVSIQHLVYVTRCRWPSNMQVGSCFEQLCAHHQESQLYQYNIWYMSLCIGDRPVCRSGPRPAYRTVTYTEWQIPDVVLIQLTLLVMSTRLLETCTDSK